MLRNVSSGMLIRLVGMLCTFLSGVYVARELGAEQFGIYSVIISLAAILAIPSQSGFGNLIIKEVSCLISSGKSHQIGSIVTWAKKRNFIMSSVVVSSACILLYFFKSNKEYYHAYILGAISVIIMSANVIGYSLLKAQLRVNLAQILEAVVYPLFFLLLIIITSNFNVLTPESTMSIRLISLLIVFAFCVYLTKLKSTDFNKKRSLTKLEKGRVNKNLLPLMLSDGLRIVQANLFLIILSFFVQPENIGNFKVAQSLINFVMLPCTVIVSIISPIIARLYIAQPTKLGSIIKKYSAFYALIQMVAFVFVYLFGEIVINKSFGMEYVESYSMLLIMTFSVFFASIFGFGDVILNMSGKGRLVLKSSIYSLFFMVTISTLLISLYDTEGAVYAFSISLVFQRWLLSLLAKKSCEFSTSLYCSR
ncbi:oligosaccharide flippase family protein [Vibrio sp. 10N.286.48.B7]|uniref:oligosaccharide flippase family protein n=1 Tax=Vibrio sp. 10N.286.48.B7 TaxID=1880853 RepID=UPI0018E450DE|nr:oligosaccharide flippase family protein [Vibrio sp. 10N.286.48.B7]